MRKKNIENEGAIRILLLAIAIVLPLVSVSYLKIQNTRISYETHELRDKIHQEEELHRKLLLMQSKYKSNCKIQIFARHVGLLPCQHKAFLIH